MYSNISTLSLLILSTFVSLYTFADVSPQLTFSQPNETIQLPVTCRVDSEWLTGYQMTVLITNPHPKPIKRWTASFMLEQSDETIISFWDADYKRTENLIEVTSWTDGGIIPPGEVVSFGFIIINAAPKPRTLAHLKVLGITD